MPCEDVQEHRQNDRLRLRRRGPAPPLALALGWLTVPSENLPVPLWAMGCDGAALTFTGLSLLIPVSLSRPRGFLAALSITALATLIDWITFGHVQGGWRFMLDSLMNSLDLRQNAAHDVVVLFAVLLTLLTLWSWIHWARHVVETRCGNSLSERRSKTQGAGKHRLNMACKGEPIL